MSFITFRQQCKACGQSWNAAFGVVGTTRIASPPGACPHCQSKDLVKVADGWQHGDDNSSFNNYGAEAVSTAQSTIAELKSQQCPGGGWTGMPAELVGRACVSDCVAYGVCGCIYGNAVQHIERLRAVPEQLASMIEGYNAGQIRMAAGEMTAQEMRSVQAVQRWWVSALRHRATELIDQQSASTEPK